MNLNTILRRKHTLCSRRQFIAGASLLLLDTVLPCRSQLAAGSLSALEGAVRFGVLADSHVDIQGKNGWRMGAISVLGLEKAVTAMNSADPDFVLVAGDLVLDGEWENLQVAKKLLDSLTAPYYIVSGNHDYRPADPSRLRRGFTYLDTADFISVFQDHGYSADGRRHWTQVTPSGLRIIGLDGCLPDTPTGWGGLLPADQLHWLDAVLADSLEPVIVMVHHCLLHWGNDANSVAGRWNSLENSPAVRGLLSRYREKIVLVISGHRHVGLHHRMASGVPYFVLPSINSHPMRYSLFTLTAGSFQWTTPGLDVEETLHEKAREGLLRTHWFSGIDDSARLALLQFYENNPGRSGMLAREAAFMGKWSR